MQKSSKTNYRNYRKKQFKIEEKERKQSVSLNESKQLNNRHPERYLLFNRSSRCRTTSFAESRTTLRPSFLSEKERKQSVSLNELKQLNNRHPERYLLFNRCDEIRTHDLCVPNAALYQTEPRIDRKLT